MNTVIKPQPYPDGIDCVWLASDRDGHLGAFITAGEGPIPAVALDAHDLPVQTVETRLLELPVVAQALLLVSVTRPDSYVELAERGLFVYDWTDVHRPTREEWNRYELVAAPSAPIAARGLPPNLQALAATIRLENVAFAGREAVDVRAHLACAEPMLSGFFASVLTIIGRPRHPRTGWRNRGHPQSRASKTQTHA